MAFSCCATPGSRAIDHRTALDAEKSCGCFNAIGLLSLHVQCSEPPAMEYITLSVSLCDCILAALTSVGSPSQLSLLRARPPSSSVQYVARFVSGLASIERDS